MNKEEETARLDQPDNAAWDELSWWEQVREVGRSHGFDFTTITLNGGNVDIKTPSNKVPAQGSPNYSPHQKRVIESFNEKRDIYADRAAVYKDNYKVVGRVMQALFPDGAPRLYDAVDYDRWHIFELVIVKLTRYTNNWDEPHKDSLDDLQVYGAILGALDDEMRERTAEQAEAERRMVSLVRGAGIFVKSREEDNEAKTHALDDLMDSDEPVIRHEHVWKPYSTGSLLVCSCGASRRPMPDNPQG